jgi:FkbM family methyltransferase
MGTLATARSYGRLVTRAPLENLRLARALRPWFRSPWRVVAHRVYKGPVRLVESAMRSGGALAYRVGTADPRVVCDLLADDEYRLGALPPGRVPWIVDVGAHIGVFARRAAPLCDRLIAYEPVPDNFALLERNLAGPEFAHVERRAVAASDRAGPLEIVLGGRNTGGHSAYADRGRNDPGTVRARSVRLSDELEERGVDRVGLLKVDCEGSEYAVFDDLARWGLDRVDRIATEYHRAPPDAPPGRSGDALEARLLGAGFRVERVPGRDEGYGLLFAVRG